MLMEVKKHLYFLLLCLKYNLAKEMENRVAFIMQIIGMMINNGMMIIQWTILFSFTSSIGGYNFTDIVLLWAISSSMFGFSHALFFNATMIPYYVTTGKLDAYLVQPKNVLINLASSKMNVSAIGDILYGLVLVIILKVNIQTFLLFLMFVVTGGLILTALHIISGCLVFMLTNSDDLSASLANTTILFGTYPEGLFSGTGKWLLFTIIPVGFTSYIPVRILNNFDIKLFVILMLFTILFVMLSFILFYKGLKKYSSSNIMSARI